MALATWWSSDPLPQFPSLPGFSAHSAQDYQALARFNHLSLLEVHARRHSGHRPYLATLNGRPVGCGWVASLEATIGELNLTFTLPEGHYFLWGFTILAEFDSSGIYPRLLGAILEQEKNKASYFWIVHDPENLPLDAGDDPTGFERVGQISFRPGGGAGLQPFENMARAHAAAQLLGIPLIESEL